MAQTKELEKVKARIRALSEKTVDRGCSEAEALAAAKKVGELLETYSLSMDEVMVREEPCVLVTIQMSTKRMRPIDAVFLTVAKFCDCRVWSSQRPNGYTLNFFGLDGDVAMARYLVTVIERAAETEAERFSETAEFRLACDQVARGARPARTVMHAFRVGMARRVAERLYALKAEREAHMAAMMAEAGHTGTALVVVKQQVVEEAMAAQFPTLRLRTRSISSSFRSRAGYAEGQKAGDRVGLDRPLNDKPVGMLT